MILEVLELLGCVAVLAAYGSFVARGLLRLWRLLIATPGYYCANCQHWFPKGYEHECIPRKLPWE